MMDVFTSMSIITDIVAPEAENRRLEPGKYR